MRGAFAGCCARATSGHAAAPPSSVMNARRVIRSPRRRARAPSAEFRGPLDWYFELGDLVNDRIVVRGIFKTPNDADLRTAIDPILLRLHRMAAAFSDFAGRFVRRHLTPAGARPRGAPRCERGSSLGSKHRCGSAVTAPNRFLPLRADDRRWLRTDLRKHCPLEQSWRCWRLKQV